MTDYLAIPPLILLADTDAQQRYQMVQTLKQAGYLTIDAGSENEVIGFFQKSHPDLVILSTNPTMGDACQRIRHLAGGAQTPILMVGNHITPQQALSLGATDSIQLTADIDVFLEMVAQLLPNQTEAYFEDILQRKTTEETFVAERQLLRTLIDNLPDYIFVKDTDGRFIISNLANAQYMGMDNPDDLIGKTDYDFFPAERADAFREDERSIITTKRPMENHEISVYHEDTDSYHWYALTKVPLYNVHDEIVGIVGLIRDITRRKEGEEQMKTAHEQLMELNNLKSHFLLSISHELRTPLNSVIGYTDMMLEEILGPLNDLQRDRMERVARNGQHLLALIEDVLTLSSIQTGTMELEPISIGIETVLAEIMPKYVEQAHEKGIALIEDVEADLPDILSDAKSVRKILGNLISNGVKFTKQGYVVVGAQFIPTGINLPIEVDPEQEWVMIYIQDTGIGITAENRRHLFNEFFRQADNSSTREHGGTGLGLALCQKLVDLMGGHIWLESSPGYGSTFFVLMPVVS